MEINFYPDSDNKDFEKAAEEYEKIWKEQGEKITSTIEKISGLKFKEKIINAVVYKYVSFSHPLSLQADVPTNLKATTLIHELCHRLLAGNEIWPKVGRDHPDHRLEQHKLLNLILYGTLLELFGKDITNKEIAYEISLWNHKGISPYKIAWDWVLAMTKEERQKEFKKYLAK